MFRCRKIRLLPYSRRLVRITGGLFNMVDTMRYVYNDAGEKAAGYKDMPAIASLGRSPSPLAVAGSRKFP